MLSNTDDIPVLILGKANCKQQGICPFSLQNDISTMVF